MRHTMPRRKSCPIEGSSLCIDADQFQNNDRTRTVKGSVILRFSPFANWDTIAEQILYACLLRVSVHDYKQVKSVPIKVCT